MPSSIELNIGHTPSPRRPRHVDDDHDGDARLRIVVLGDFSGRPTAERGALSARRPVRVDIDTLEAVFARFAPMVQIDDVQDKLGVALRIPLETLDDLGADALLARLPARAAPPAASGAPATADDAPAAAAEPAPADVEDAAATLRRLLGGNVPVSAPARAAPAPATVAEKSSATVDRFIRQLMGAPSATSTAQAPSPAPAGANAGAASLLSHVLRDPAWRHLESAWRSVDRFVRQLEMADGAVRLELLDCRADEVLADLVAAQGEAARSALIAALHGDGRGCAIVVSLEEFGPSVQELSLLGGLATLAASQGAILLAGAAPALAAVATSDDPEILATPAAQAWHALRDSALGPRIGMTFPRLLARLPYGPRNEPVTAFPFDELAGLAPSDLRAALLWRSAALDAALLLAQGYSEAGGDSGVESQVQLDDLPAFIDRSGDEAQLQAVAEAYLGERETGLLQTAGFITFLSDRRVPKARVAGWQSIGSGGAPLSGSWRDA